MLFEDNAARIARWAGPLLAGTEAAYGRHRLLWGARALRWARMESKGHPVFEHTTNLSCMVPHPDPKASAFLHRDEQAFTETEQYIAWVERADDGTLARLCLLPIKDGVAETVEAFSLEGAVPAFSYDYATGAVRCTERFMADGTLHAFADHVGEAYTVLVTMPLYAGEDDEAMFTEDFALFETVAPWTVRGRAAAREASEKQDQAAPAL
jgi:hypothetical protein